MRFSDSYEPMPVVVISGFLGSGKTSMLNRILTGRHGLRVAVLVNDFGEIDIDARLIVGIEGETISLSNGCICCNIRGDLAEALLDLVSRDDAPEVVLIETSGVSEPLAVVQTLYLPEMRPLIHADALLTVVDCETLLTHRDEEERLATDQLRCADVVILNKIDLVDAPGLAAVRDHVARVTPKARRFETTFGDVPFELILGLDRNLSGSRPPGVDPGPPCVPSHPESTPSHLDVFRSWSYRTRDPLSLPAIEKALRDLPESVYRLKGIFHLREEPDIRHVLQVVGWRIHGYRAGGWGEATPETVVTAIGRLTAGDQEELTGRFDRCRAAGPAGAGSSWLGETVDWFRRRLGGS